MTKPCNTLRKNETKSPQLTCDMKALKYEIGLRRQFGTDEPGVTGNEERQGRAQKAGIVWAEDFDGDTAAWELSELIIHAGRRRRWVSRGAVGECLQAADIWEQEAAVDSVSTHCLLKSSYILGPGEGFAIPVNRTQGRLSHCHDLRHLGP